MRVYLDNCCYNRPFDPQTDLRIVVASMSPMDYTTWHQRRFNNGESVRELGEKIKAFAATRRAAAEA